MVDQNRERATGALHLYDVCTTFFQELRMYKNSTLARFVTFVLRNTNKCRRPVTTQIYRYNIITIAHQRLRSLEYFKAMSKDAAKGDLMLMHVIKYRENRNA